MRLRIYGIPKLALFLIGAFPAIAWCAFHPFSVLYQRPDFFWACALGGLSGFLLTFLIRRGVFISRHLIHVIFSLGIGAGLISAVFDRDFTKLGVGLVAFALFVALVLWLERKIASASLNPEHLWFEGELRWIPEVRARIRIRESMVPAKVRRLDASGGFLIFDQPFSFRPGERVWFEIGSGSSKIEGDAAIASSFQGEKMGLGLQFLAKDLYHFSNFTALVQELRGKGL